MKDKIPFPVLITGLVFLGLMAMFTFADTHILSYLKNQDELLLFLANEKHSRFWDLVLKESASFWFWIPFYCFLLLMLLAYDRVRFLRKVIFILIYLLVSIGSLTALNRIFGHLRPLYDQSFKTELKISINGAGELYGCLPIPSIAAGLAILMVLFFGRRHLILNGVIGLWALLYMYSRAYNSWNYPSEIIFGAGFSLALGYLSFYAYNLYLKKSYAG
ncbi:MULTISPECIES: hypothetical protein [Pedobacter]|uniref:Phosphatidic acid phosphatase type 2/haloperoxidase domain-containing protein n=1 Tax=Pedobacter kyungheensis TaxID=1069985 RepID=A0A0C1FSI3_9SPHI|nr:MULTISPECIES: hypothetical protein [Pedobacter]KIA94718.1 hypothetical protein OC25_08605 [Pedobacter kyungheensis]